MEQGSNLHHGCFEYLKGDDSNSQDCDVPNVAENMASELIDQYDDHRYHAQSPSRSRCSPQEFRKPNHRRFQSTQAMNCGTLSTMRRRNVVQPDFNTNRNNATLARNPHIQNFIKQRLVFLVYLEQTVFLRPKKRLLYGYL